MKKILFASSCVLALSMGSAMAADNTNETNVGPGSDGNTIENTQYGTSSDVRIDILHDGDGNDVQTYQDYYTEDSKASVEIIDADRNWVGIKQESAKESRARIEVRYGSSDDNWAGINQDHTAYSGAKIVLKNGSDDNHVRVGQTYALGAWARVKVEHGDDNNVSIDQTGVLASEASIYVNQDYNEAHIDQTLAAFSSASLYVSGNENDAYTNQFGVVGSSASTYVEGDWNTTRVNQEIGKACTPARWFMATRTLPKSTRPGFSTMLLRQLLAGATIC